MRSADSREAHIFVNIPTARRFTKVNAARMDEERAIQLCLKHRDPIGFEFLVNKYRREAFFHAFSLLGNNEDALDACQDAFARAFAAIPRLEALTQFYPWFYRILRNHCLNMLERRETSDRYRQSRTLEAGNSSPSPEAGPRATLEQAEGRWRVREALDRLRPEYREILTLKYLQDCSYERIARLLGIPRGTVMSRLYHARLALRETCAADPALNP